MVEKSKKHTQRAARPPVRKFRAVKERLELLKRQFSSRQPCCAYSPPLWALRCPRRSLQPRSFCRRLQRRAAGTRCLLSALHCTPRSARIRRSLGTCAYTPRLYPVPLPALVAEVAFPACPLTRVAAAPCRENCSWRPPPTSRMARMCRGSGSTRWLRSPTTPARGTLASSCTMQWRTWRTAPTHPAPRSTRW